MSVRICIVTGFLSAGKTAYIKREIEKSSESDKGIAVIQCENGIIQYEDDWLSKHGAILKKINGKTKDLKQEMDLCLRELHNCTKIYIEYNGMWSLDSLFKSLFMNPVCDFEIEQKCFVADSRSILNYQSNMSTLVADKIAGSDICILNRLNKNDDVESFKNMVLKYSGRSALSLEYMQGGSEFIPRLIGDYYDFSSEKIVIDDQSFPYFCYDIENEPDKYEGRRIQLEGYVLYDDSLDEQEWLIGRNISRYSEYNVLFCAFIVRSERSEVPKEKTWVSLEAEVSITAADKEPLFAAKKVIQSSAPQDKRPFFN